MILFINACTRKMSRTLGLAREFLNDIDEEVREKNLYEMRIPFLDEKAIEERTKAAEIGDLSDIFVAMASELAYADHIVIAAPYWDMAYPAVLRSYIEAIMVVGVTFSCRDDGSYEGLCKAKDLTYITTAGGPITGPNLGFEHIKAVFTSMLGIEETHYFSAESLDLVGADVQAILDKTGEELREHKEANFITNFPIMQGVGGRVLIVDDSKVNILKAEHILKEYGYMTMTATSGQECLKTLFLHKPDLILLDIEMPGMNGFETLEEIRKYPDLAKIPVIFVTGDKDLEIVVKASKYRVAGYVVKPFSEDQLLLHVRKGLGMITN